MYDPIQDGVERTARCVRYTVEKPPSHLSGLVHCYWELKTDAPLDDVFCLHAVPDACVNILFNQIDTEIAGVTALRTTFEVLNLGTWFHYVGIQLLPGVWQGNRCDIADQFVGSPYGGVLPLVASNKKMGNAAEFADKQEVMSDLVQWFIDAKLAASNFVTEKILTNMDAIRTVNDMAACVCLSPRQLQRTLRQTTGFAPHDLLKILRIQQSFKQHYLDLYADQSHYIHSFRKVTGYTPSKYAEKFHV